MVEDEGREDGGTPADGAPAAEARVSVWAGPGGSNREHLEEGLVHRLWPLVADPESPVGVRFASIGEDPVGSRLVDPARLPDHEIGLVAFESRERLLGWIDAAKAFGGRFSFEILDQPPRDGAEPNGKDDFERSFAAALYAAHDRPKGSGATMEDAVRLHGTVEPAEAERARREALKHHRRARMRERWNELFARTIAAIDQAVGTRLHRCAAQDRLSRSLDGVYVDVKTGSTIPFLIGMADDGTLEARVQWCLFIRATSDATLGFDRSEAEAVAAAGWRLGTSGTIRRAFEATADGVARLDEALTAIEAARAERDAAAARLDLVRGLCLLRDASTILIYAEAGLPVVLSDARKAHQMTRHGSVSRHLVSTVERLIELGLLEPAYWIASPGAGDRGAGVTDATACAWTTSALGMRFLQIFGVKDTVGVETMLAEIAVAAPAAKAAASAIVQDAEGRIRPCLGFGRLADLDMHGVVLRVDFALSPKPKLRKRRVATAPLLPRTGRDLAIVAAMIAHGAIAIDPKTGLEIDDAHGCADPDPARGLETVPAPSSPDRKRPVATRDEPNEDEPKAPPARLAERS